MTTTGVEIDTEHARWRAKMVEGFSLPPVLLAVGTGVAHTQDYLTPDQARQLGLALVALADEAER